ncbi:MAG: hypothetical protein QF579_00715 [Dehalococcoidia bacterium]|nr:hypothetical protein [Dehalococcoidia bacterium]
MAISLLTHSSDISFVPNIGYGGIDGFSVDSLFDIEYSIERSSSFDTEIVALSPTVILGDPDFDLASGAAMDAVGAGVISANRDIYYGPSDYTQVTFDQADLIDMLSSRLMQAIINSTKAIYRW